MTLEHLDTALGFAVIMLLLSLLITVLVQTITGLLGLRGSNLHWGVEQLLSQLDPTLVPHAKAIAEQTLKHSALAPIKGRKATAIRPEELVRILDQIAAQTPCSDAAAQEALKRLADSVVPGASPELSERAAALTQQVEQLFPAQAEAIKGVIRQGLGSTRKLVAGVSTWFQTVMDRSTERFVTQVRWATAIVALLFAFILHVDSLQLLQQLSQDSELRAKVVAASEGTLRKAEDVVTLTAERKAVASSALVATREQYRGKPVAEFLGKIPTQLITREQGEAWLRGRLKNLDKGDSVMAVYHAHFDTATMSWLGELRNAAAGIDSQLQQASFQLIPKPYPPFASYVTNLRHLAGTLMTVLLLTLGAPFWYNVLRQLANLRPVIAHKVDKETGVESGHP